MILEVFYSKPPAHRREIILRKESRDGDINRLLRIGEAHQSDAEHIYYHILFEGQPIRKEAPDAGREKAAV